MKNKIIMLLGLLLLPLNVFAATGTIKATSSSTKVTLNNTVTVTVKVSSTDYLGTWRYGLSYDKSKLSLQSGETSIVGYGDGTYSSKTYTYKFKAIAVGSAKITIDNPEIADWTTESKINTTKTDLTLNIKEPVIITYSSDNNLSSLSIDGFDLLPEFNKNTLEYSVTTLPTTTSVKVNAKLSDNKAKLTGTGDVNVIEGTNEVKVVVTAENGTSKTYVINVTVPEKDPIKYTFGKEEYSILRKLPENIPLNYNKSTLKFNEEEVPCLQNETLNITLIYLRNKNNKENFYIYNQNKKIVELYNEISNNDLKIYLTNEQLDIKGLIKTELNVNSSKVIAYQIQNNSKDYLVKGRNTSTGEKNIYVYDKNSKTISIFNEKDYNYLKDNANLYKLIAIGEASGVLVLLIIIILMAKNKKKLVKINNKKNEKKDN